MNKSFKKIMIFGRPGSGKSTFAHELHIVLDIPVYHLDKFFFTNNWQERNYQEFLAIQQTFVEQPLWIIDGNSTKSLEMRWSRADIVLYFNFPRWLCYLRVFKRLLFKNKLIDDRAKACAEKVSFSLLRYMWTFEERVDCLITSYQYQYPQTPFI